jgi:mono/diheme cytochrome c family protein
MRYAPLALSGLGVLVVLSLGGIATSGKAADPAADQAGAPAQDAAASGGACCKAGDTTPPTELVKKVPKGQLKSPYQDFKKVAEEGHKHFLRPGCNECHGGTGGGGMCPALTQGVWFWGSDDDVLFRLITLGTEGLKQAGFTRLAQGSVQGPMPPMGAAIDTSDHLWQIIAWIRSVNPPGSEQPSR